MTILRRGDKGSDVVTLQTALARAGYSPGTIDGVFGPRTEDAVRNFQRAMNLTVDGIVGSRTWAALSPYMNTTPVPPPPYYPDQPDTGFLKRGDRGQAVIRLQTGLSTAGYDVGNIDGIFGTRTENAVKKFQRVFGLDPDGYVTPAVWDLLSPFLTDPNPAILRRGSVGTRVTNLQTALRRLGYYTYTIDGLFGTRTQAAVQSFQAAYGLPVTGIVDAATAQRLGLSTLYPPSYYPPNYITYTVRAGDTLYSIARRYNTTVSALLNANPRANPDRIYVGETLIIPV